jgi:hypothetical protein
LQKGNIVDTNWKKVPVEPTPEMIAAMAVEEATGTCDGVPTIGMSGASLAYDSMIAAAPEYKPRHSLEEDFQHFLAYQNWLGLSDDEIARLRIAYEHGASRGE